MTATKMLSIVAFSLVLLASFGFVSAASSNGVILTVNQTSLSNVTSGETYSFIATVENNNGSAIYVTFGTSGWTWNTTGSTIANGATETFKGVLTIPSSGNKNVILNVYNDSNHSQSLFADITQQITLSYYNSPSSTSSFCKEGTSNVAELSIDSLEYKVSDGVGDEDEKVYATDELEFSFTVENNGDWDVENTKIEICFADEDGDCIFDEDDFDLSDEEFDLDQGDDLDITATIELDADEMTSGNSDYTFKVRATGDVDDKDSAYDGNSSCTWDSQDVEVATETFVIIDDIQLNPSEASCSSSIELSASVWNVGEDDLKDDEVYVQVYSKELGIDKAFEFDNGIDSLEKEDITLSFEVPKGLADKTYKIEFSAYEDEDMSDSDLFENDNEDESVYYGYLVVKGCGASTSNTTSQVILPTLASEAIEGKNLVVTATITNNGDNGQIVVSPTGYESWATLVSVEPSILTLDDGKTGVATITLLPTATGSKTFTIQTIANGKITSQTVSVTIAEKESFFNQFGLVHYLIAGIVVVLLLIVFTLIVKKSSKPKAY